MSPAKAISRPKTVWITRLVLIILFIWFAAPEAQSYTPNFNPRLHTQLTQQIILQLELAKHDSGNILTKQFVPICDFNYEPTVPSRPVKLIEVFIEVNLYHRNAFYVHTTINAP